MEALHVGSGDLKVYLFAPVMNVGYFLVNTERPGFTSSPTWSSGGASAAAALFWDLAMVQSG